MSTLGMSTPLRRPAAFTLDNPNVVLAEAEREPDPFTLAPEAGPAALPVAVALTKPRRRFGWAGLFAVATGGLVTLGAALIVTQLIESLFARNVALGWTGVTLAALAALAFIGIVTREARALLRLSEIDGLRERAAATILSDDRKAGIGVARELVQLTRNAPNLARGRKTLETHIDDIIDGADLVRLAETNLMAPLDVEARRLVSAAATRVSIVTAVSPRAIVDMAFVLLTALSLVRRLAYLYGGRPGTLAMLRLIRHAVAHVTVTGGLAIGDGLVQQVLGHGVVAKLSSRLGEGMLNGLLTARLGLAAIAVTRPLPFAALPPPSLSAMAEDLLRQR